MIRELIQEYRKYRNFRTYIESSNWDEILLSDEGALNNCCLGVVVFAISFFGTHIVMMVFKKIF
jgi:hypothetical protein